MLPLSFNQSTHLVLDWLKSVRSKPIGYRPVVFAQRFDGPLDTTALQEALAEIVRRHEVLRTAFPDPRRLTSAQEAALLTRLDSGDISADGVFTQTIVPQVEVALSFRDAVPGPHETPDATLKRFVHDAIQEPFDYDAPPLLRATLFQEAAGAHVLLIVLHHLVTDYWSQRVLADELVCLYNLRVRTQPLSDVACPPIQFGDFALAQRRQFGGSLPPAELEFWQQHWMTYGSQQAKPSELRLGRRHVTDRVVSRVERVDLPASVIETIEQGTRALRVTSYMFCTAALAVLFHAYTGRRDVAWWAYCANRTSADTYRLIGWFAQGRILGVRVVPDESVRDLCAKVRGAVHDMLRRQHVPLQLIWHALREGADAFDASNEFFSLNVVRELGTAPLADGVTMSGVPLDVTAADVGSAIKLLAFESNDGICAVGAGYCDGSFDAADIRRVLDDFVRVLAGLAGHPDQRVSHVAALVGHL